jgi:hypothetical protein
MKFEIFFNLNFLKLLYKNIRVKKDNKLIYELYIKTINYMISLNVQIYKESQNLINL